MTTITITANTAVGSHPNHLTTITDFFAELGAGMRDGNAIETRYRALSRMTRSELAALGLTRADIARAALAGGRI